MTELHLGCNFFFLYFHSSVFFFLSPDYFVMREFEVAARLNRLVPHRIQLTSSINVKMNKLLLFMTVVNCVTFEIHRTHLYCIVCDIFVENL